MGGGKSRNKSVSFNDANSAKTALLNQYCAHVQVNGTKINEVVESFYISITLE